MKRIGIFLGYPPEVSLRKEGISRLLGFIMKAAIADDRVKLVIACPKWLEGNVRALLEDHHIDGRHVELMTTRAVPALIRMSLFVRKFVERSKSQKLKLRRRLAPFVKRVLYNLRQTMTGGSWGKKQPREGKLLAVLFGWMATSSILVFLASVFVAAGIALIAFIPAALLVLGWLVWMVIKRLEKVPSPFTRIFTLPANLLQHNQLIYIMYDNIRRFEFIRLIRRINKRHDIVAWYIPTLFWPEMVHINAPKVVTAPDIVFLEFPSFFNKPVFPRTYKRMMESLWSADAFTCYSEYVRDYHLGKLSAVDTSKVSVIRHGRVDLRSYLLPAQTKEMTAEQERLAMRQRALRIIRDYQREPDVVTKHYHFYHLDFAETPFIFYSSQYRFYKNLHSLVKAFARLRLQYPELRLVLTANVSQDADLKAYIEQQGLAAYILEAYDVPTSVLAALNNLAICAVNPTLFEGGFPFTFCEAYSVGTPSVMSNIPVVMELVKTEKLRKLMLFDPYDQDEMVERIGYALEHPDVLLREQRHLYDSYPQWEDVARTYIDAVLAKGEAHVA